MDMATAGELYARAPFLRRSGVVLAMLIAGVAPCVAAWIHGMVAITPIELLAPLAPEFWLWLSPEVVPCLIMLTGPVYTARLSAGGELERWDAVLTKTAAALSLAAWAYLAVKWGPAFIERATSQLQLI